MTPKPHHHVEDSRYINVSCEPMNFTPRKIGDYFVKKIYSSSKERYAAWLQKRKKEGFKHLSVLASPEIHQKINELIEYGINENISDVICESIETYYKKKEPRFNKTK